MAGISSVDLEPDVVVRGLAMPVPDDLRVSWTAAAAPDRRTSYSGYGMPYASRSQAYHGPQTGTATTDSTGRFAVSLRLPNSYHAGTSELPVPPQVLVEWVSGGRRHRQTLLVPGSAPRRTLWGAPPAEQTAFSDVVSQEALIRSLWYTPGG